MNQLAAKVKKEFVKRFGRNGILIQSPGRVNLIGGHTDYNDGFVLPVAIDKSICLAISVNHSTAVHLFAMDKRACFEADITEPLQKSPKGWPDYITGVMDQLLKNGYEISGFDCAFSGDVPIGAGMSSSAALEVGILFGLVHLFDLEIAPEEMALLAQKAENEFVGVQCGIMDQFISLNGKKEHVMKLDCRSLAYEFYPFKHHDIQLLICDTRVRRELASSEYNMRRSQCEEGVKKLQQYDASIKSLRDVSTELLQAHEQDLDPIVYKRCDYIVNENIRVLKACDDLEKNDLKAFGERMYIAHEGLRDKYEISCKELDILIEASRNVEGVYGARMMGGGFGGCTVNLVKDTAVKSFKKQVAENYKQKTGKEVKIYQTEVSGGTHLVEKIKKRSVKV